MFVCIYVCVLCAFLVPTMTGKGYDPLELELQKFMSYEVGARNQT